MSGGSYKYIYKLINIIYIFFNLPSGKSKPYGVYVTKRTKYNLFAIYWANVFGNKKIYNLINY